MRKGTLQIIALALIVPRVLFAYAALALDQEKGNIWGWAVDQPTRQAAADLALKKVKELNQNGKAILVMTFQGGAGAYAVDMAKGSTAIGWARAATADRAKELALKYCREKGGPSAEAIIRVWGQESQTDKSSTLSTVTTNQPSTDERVKVYAELEFSMQEKWVKGKNDGHYYAIFTGWTYATKEELQEYGESYRYLLYSDEVTGKRRDAIHLITPDNRLPSEYACNIPLGRLDGSPIMRRFIEAVVKKHPYYAGRRLDDQYTRDVLVGSDGEFRYNGALIVQEDDLTYDVVRKSRMHYSLTKPKEDTFLYRLVDSGQF